MHPIYAMRFIASISALTLLVACGTKTPLTLPPPPPGSPAASKPAAQPATQPTVAPASTSTVDDSNKAASETLR
jgi:hypothetical protein